MDIYLIQNNISNFSLEAIRLLLSSSIANVTTNKIRVLLVDDEKNQTELATLNLEKFSIMVRAAFEPSQALRLLAEQSYDCIVSDYKMPEMNGIQLCNEVRKTSSIPFILYTGHGSEEIASAAFAAGVDDYVRKEETLAHYSVLAKRIQHAVERRRTESNLQNAVDQLKADRGLLDNIIKHASVGINLVRGSDLTYQLINPYYQSIAPRKEILGKTIKEVWPEIYPQLEKIYKRVLKTGKPHHSIDEKFVIKRRIEGPPEEAYFTWSLIRVPIPGESGWGVLNTMVETTERLKTEEKAKQLSSDLKQENERLSALVNSIQDEVWFADIEKKFTLANPSALKEFGIVSTEPNIDIEKFALSLEVHRPDGSIRPVEESPPLRALRGEVVTRQEEMVKSPVSGELRYRSVSAAPVRDSEGKIIGSVSVARDITDRKKAQEALRESEERYRMIFDKGQIGIAVSDLEGRLLLTNPSFQRMLGYTEVELQNKNFRELTLDADLTEENKYVSELIEGKRDGYNIEKRYVRKDGRVIWVEIAASMFRSAEGKPAFGVIMALDINDRKRFEEALRESNLKVHKYANKLEDLVEERTSNLRLSEKKLRDTVLYTRSLIEASLDPLVTINAEGKITDVNEATIKVTGVSREHLIGSDFSDYFTDPENARAGYQKVFEKGELKDYPLAIKSATGEAIDVLYNATVYKNEQGEVQGIFAAARDVTEMKKAEKRLQEASHYTRSLIEASLDPLVTINAEGKITDVNEATIKVTGVSREHLIGSDFSDYFTDPENARAGYQKVFAEGYVRDYPLVIRDKSGKLTDVLYNAAIYRNQSGEVVGIFAAARDVTEKNRLIERLHRSEVIAAVEQMGATVAHDLRGPLGMIVQSVNMIKRDPSLEPRMLQIVEENAVRSLKMISDWRSSTREMMPHPVKTNINDLIMRVLEGEPIPNNIDVTSLVSEELNEVKIDPDIMHRVIDNLVKNAIEAMPMGGKLSVNAKKDRDAIIISVSDSGVGIPTESRIHIFSPLFTTKPGGMGLGLTYCTRAIEAMEGSIDFESKVGEGTTFFIKLPFKSG